MKILDERGLSGTVKRFLDLIFAGGAIIWLALPLILGRYMELLYGTKEKYWFLLPFMYVTGFFALVIVFELRHIFKTLNRRNPFMTDNVMSFKRIGLACFIIAGVYITKIIFFNSFLTIILMMVFVIAGFFSIILAEVFYQAVMVKEENDLTI